MIITKNWLNEFVDVSGVSVDELCVRLNEIGLEVDALAKWSVPRGVVVGRVLTCRDHENSDHLHVCEVDLGAAGGVRQIVCGAPNVAAGQFVAVATCGTTMPSGLVIKPSRLRGVESNGMICSSTELGLSKINDGIMVLDASVADGENGENCGGGAPNSNLGGADGGVDGENCGENGANCGLVLGRELAQMRFFQDAVIELGVTPNRADCLGVYGVARDVAAAYELPVRLNAPRVDGVEISRHADGVRLEATFECDKSVKFIVGAGENCGENGANPCENRAENGANFAAQIRAKFDAKFGENRGENGGADGADGLNSNLLLLGVGGAKNTLKTQLRTAACEMFSEDALQNVLNYVLLESNTAFCAFAGGADVAVWRGVCGATQASSGGASAVLGLDDGVKNLAVNSPATSESQASVANSNLDDCGENNAGAECGGNGAGDNATATPADFSLVLNFTPANVIAELVAKHKSLKSAANAQIAYRTARGSEPNFAIAIASLARNFSRVRVCDSAGSVATMREVSFRASEIFALVGDELAIGQIAQILACLEFDFISSQSCGGAGDYDVEFVVQTPPHRADIANAADIAEEIVRYVGIDNIPARPLILAEKNRTNASYEKYLHAKELRERAAAKGFFECVHYAFDSSAQLAALGYEPCRVEVANPISSELDALKPTLLNHLLNSAERNAKNRQKRIWLFEYGEVFAADGTQGSRLAFVASGADNWASLAAGTKPRELGFYEFASLVQGVIGKFEVKVAPLPPFVSEFEGGEVWQNGVRVGFLGRLDLEVQESRELGKTYVCELDFAALGFGRRVARAYSRLPFVVRDISVVVGADVRYEVVKRAVENAAKRVEILRSFGLIDVFALAAGDGAAGEKSLTLRLEFGRLDSTLTDEEVNAAVDEILLSLKCVGARLR